jgi:hypothetical protein
MESSATATSRSSAPAAVGDCAGESVGVAVEITLADGVDDAAGEPQAETASEAARRSARRTRPADIVDRVRRASTSHFGLWISRWCNVEKVPTPPRAAR